MNKMDKLQEATIKVLQEGVSWDYFNKTDDLCHKYLPRTGEGDNYAEQIVTAISKLVYKWYNDGDTYDTKNMSGGANDLSSYANWLAKYVDGAKEILDRVISNDFYWDDADAYEDILKDIVDNYMTEEFLEQASKSEKVGTIYNCDGDYSCEDNDEEDWY